MTHHFAGIQIYGDEKASTDDCFKMFNPVDKITFDVRKSRVCTSSHVHSILAICLTSEFSFPESH